MFAGHGAHSPSTKKPHSTAAASFLAVDVDMHCDISCVFLDKNLADRQQTFGDMLCEISIIQSIFIAQRTPSSRRASIAVHVYQF